MPRPIYLVITALFLCSLAEHSHAKDSIRVMPLGNSITEGAVNYNYRMYLWEQLDSLDGVAFDFVGSRPGYGSLPYDRDHEGHGGFTTWDIRWDVEVWLDRNPPDVILLMIGTNDITQGNAYTAHESLDTLVRVILSHVPDITLFLASVPPIDVSSVDTAEVNAYNAHVPEIVNRYSSGGFEVYFVDMYHAVDPGDLPDGVHPNEQGYRDIAATWYAALTDWLSTPIAPSKQGAFRSFTGPKYHLRWNVATPRVRQRHKRAVHDLIGRSVSVPAVIPGVYVEQSSREHR